MDKFMDNLVKRLEKLGCKICGKFYNKLKIISSEGIVYNIKIKWESNNKIYILENDNFRKRAKIGKYSFKSKYFDENSVIDMFEYYILLNDLYFNEFKIGMEHYIKSKKKMQIIDPLKDEKYMDFKDEIDIHRCIAHILKKGYEFASEYPLPEVIEKQYEILKNKAIENITIEAIKDFMLKNEDIHIYLDEKKPTEVMKDLRNIKEIEYSYGHIVAKSYTYNIKMSLLPLDGEIMVFDTEGINEIAKCNVKEYKEIYEKKMIENLFNNIKVYEEEKCIVEREENEQD